MALGMFVSLMVSTAAALVVPRLAQTIIDQGIGLGDMAVVVRMSLAMVGLTILSAIFQFAQGALGARTAHGIAYDLRNALYGKIQSLSFSYHDRAQTGQLLTRATSDVETVQRFVGQGSIMFFSAILMMGGAMTFLFVTNWRLALVMVVVIPVTFAAFGFFCAPRHAPVQASAAAPGEPEHRPAREHRRGARRQGLCARSRPRARAMRPPTRISTTSISGSTTSSRWPFPPSLSISNVASLFIYWIGGRQVIGGALTIGQLVAFANYIMMVFFPVLMMGMIIAMLSRPRPRPSASLRSSMPASDVVEQAGRHRAAHDRGARHL